MGLISLRSDQNTMESPPKKKSFDIAFLTGQCESSTSHTGSHSSRQIASTSVSASIRHLEQEDSEDSNSSNASSIIDVISNPSVIDESTIASSLVLKSKLKTSSTVKKRKTSDRAQSPPTSKKFREFSDYGNGLVSPPDLLIPSLPPPQFFFPGLKGSSPFVPYGNGGTNIVPPLKNRRGLYATTAEQAFGGNTATFVQASYQAFLPNNNSDIITKRGVSSQSTNAPTSPLLPPSLAALSLPAQNVCAKCKIGFRMTSDLVYHMRSHHKREMDPQQKKREEKLKCPVCHEAFRERHHLTRHMTAHQDRAEETAGAAAATATN